MEGQIVRDFERKEYADLYNLALYSATERSEQIRLKREGDDKLQAWELIAISIAISVLVTSTLFCIWLKCIRKRQKNGTTSCEGASESESELSRPRGAVENDVDGRRLSSAMNNP